MALLTYLTTAYISVAYVSQSIYLFVALELLCYKHRFRKYLI